MPLKISDMEWDRLYPNMQVALNPTREAAHKAVAKVQARCRKNLLSKKDIDSCMDAVVSRQAASQSIGVVNCPEWFEFGIDTTILQFLWITNEVLGMIALRYRVEPGQRLVADGSPPQRGRPKNTTWPISIDPLRDPVGWHRQVIEHFWAHLDDQTEETLKRNRLVEVMRRAAERDSQHAERDAARRGRFRHLQIKSLFATTAPVYISELSAQLAGISAQLSASGTPEISWADFQRRWVSFSARYRRELLRIQKGGVLGVEDLRSYQPQSEKYTVSFDYWKGPQRIFPTEQLVFQMSAPAVINRWKSMGGNHAKLLRRLEKDSTSSPHPTTKSTVGWLRVHVDDMNRLGFVDEVQSDWYEWLRDEQDKTLASAAVSMAEDIADWNLHGFAAVLRWCQIIGYQSGLHSRDTAARIEGYTPSDRKWNTYYKPIVTKFQLQPVVMAKYGGSIYCSGANG